MRINSMKGSDLNIDRYPAKVAYIVYWNEKHQVLSTPTMYAETVYPLSLIDAIRVFAPNCAAGANVDFQLVDGQYSNTLVIKF